MTDLAEIRAYWEASAKSNVDADGLKPTARDPYLQAAVEHAIEQYIPAGAKLYDFGCGEGSSTARFAKRAGQTFGFDYIESYVTSAQDAHPAIHFERADVTDLSDVRNRHGLCNVAVTIRCLINLPTPQLQKAAISEIAKTVKPGGLYLLSEGWLEGWDGLNDVRKSAGLDPMRLVGYNRLISRSELADATSGLFGLVDYVNLGFYIFMSRIFQPAFMAPDTPLHTHKINEVAQSLLARGVCRTEFQHLDYAGVLVMRRL